MKLDLRKQIGDKDMKIETVLKRALHLEAVARIEEEEQTPKVAVIRQDETKGFSGGRHQACEPIVSR